MGIIKAIGQAIGGTLADQWLEVIEADDMSDKTVFTSGVLIRKGQNTKGTGNTVSNGSIIHVYDNQFMMLVDGGKVVDYTAEPGYYKVDNSSLPSLFNGQFGDSLKDSFNRIKYGGQTPTAQKVFFINLQEIKGIKFGTRNPINYFDNFYNAELFLRAHGTYSVKITNPLQFYAEVIAEIKDDVREDQIIITIAPGKTLAWLKEQFGKNVKIVRTMPNTPALVGAGMTAACPNEYMTKEEIAYVLTLLESFGRVEIIPERLMDTVVSVSGSSPAYVFMFIEAMADAAVSGGMPRAQAYQFAAQAVLGSAKMVLETGKHPGELKDMVCSPAGTTIEAVRVLEEKGFRSSVIEAMKTCEEISKSM